MNSFFAFDFIYSPKSEERPQRVAIIFCSRDILEIDRLIEKMSDFLAAKAPPDKLVVLGGSQSRNH
jgi:hypothetical protein